MANLVAYRSSSLLRYLSANLVAYGANALFRYSVADLVAYGANALLRYLSANLVANGANVLFWYFSANRVRDDLRAGFAAIRRAGNLLGASLRYPNSLAAFNGRSLTADCLAASRLINAATLARVPGPATSFTHRLAIHASWSFRGYRVPVT
jgi:hypothetical protein